MHEDQLRRRAWDGKVEYLIDLYDNFETRCDFEEAIRYV